MRRPGFEFRRGIALLSRLFRRRRSSGSFFILAPYQLR
jgi:hypothetical protein